MGLFKNIGRKVEEFKQTSEAVAAEEARYECTECGKRLYTNHDACPECGGTVVSLADESETTDGSKENPTDKSEEESTDDQ
jgi:rRNA maturation endonuclease Nob1